MNEIHKRNTKRHDEWYTNLLQIYNSGIVTDILKDIDVTTEAL